MKNTPVCAAYLVERPTSDLTLLALKKPISPL